MNTAATDIFEFTAENRTDFGKAHNRRLRRLQDRVPAIVYGAGEAPLSISLQHKDLLRAFKNEAVYSHILTLKVGDKPEQVVLKDIQRHPAKPKIMHLDFLRIKANEALHITVPMNVLGEDKSAAIKAGGIVSKLMSELDIKCLPKDLPESISIDISELSMESTVHLSDVNLPAGVELATPTDENHNPAVLSVHKPKVKAEVETAAPEAGETEISTEKVKAEDEKSAKGKD